MKEILGRRGLVYIAAITTFLILVGGGCLSILEPQTVKGGYGDGIWWAVVTASTVGYGDISPSTPWGRIIAVLLMVVGIGLMSTLAASITSYFVQQTANTESRDLIARLDRIERVLDQVASANKPAQSNRCGPES
jgi:voltage-gated potassium channel